MAEKISGLTVESMNVLMETSIDPTDGVVQFAFVTVDTKPDLDNDFVAGEWVTDWDIITHHVTAKTPTVGHASGATVALASSVYHVWIKLDIGDESIVQLVSKLTVD